MTRLTIAVSMALAATATTVIAGISFFAPVSADWAVTERAWLSLQFFDGRVRLFWVTSRSQAIELIPTTRGADFVVRPASTPDTQTARTGRSVGQLRNDGAVLVRIGDRQAVGPFGGRWRSPTGGGRRSGTAAPTPSPGGGNAPPRINAELSYVRVPYLPLVCVLLYHPVRTIITGPWLQRRRRRRNQCTTCGYSLIGNTSGICPECGIPIPEDERESFSVRT